MRGRGRERRDKRLYRGAGTEGVNGKDKIISGHFLYVSLSFLGSTTEAKNFSIFDTPGSDSFNFGSHHDSIHDSQASLEWDPQGDRTPCRSLIIV